MVRQTREQTQRRQRSEQQLKFGERHHALHLHQASLPQRRFSGAVAHDFGSLDRKRKAQEVSPRQCVRDRPRQQTRNSFERTLSVETSGSINDSPTAVPERQLFNFVCYAFYDIVHFSQLIKNLISVIIFYHRDMKVNTRGSIFRVFIKFATRKCC